MNEEKFTQTAKHGGKRPNAGRKPGVKIGKIKPETILFSRRVTKEQYELLEAYLNELRSDNNK